MEHGLEGIGRQLLRHEADHGARGAVVGDDIVTVHPYAAFARIDDPADDADQGRLPRAVGAEQREDLSAADVQADVLESPEAGGVGFGEVRDGDDGLHGNSRWIAVRFAAPPVSRAVLAGVDGGKRAAAGHPWRHYPRCSRAARGRGVAPSDVFRPACGATLPNPVTAEA